MFELEYDSADDLPPEVKHLYKEGDDGRFSLIKAGEIKTAQDVLRVQEGLRKEREDHKETRKKLSRFNNMDPDELYDKLDRIEELEAAASGKLDDEQINKLVESRIKSKTAPLERELNQLRSEREELSGMVKDFETREVRRSIRDDVYKAATAAKVRDTALEDVLFIGENLFERDESGQIVTRDGVGVTPGINAEVWLTEAKNTRPHWWPESQGTGARGGDGGRGGVNPFSKDGWNLTEQGRVIRESPDKAQQMAKSAGTSVGGPRPAK